MDGSGFRRCSTHKTQHAERLRGSAHGNLKFERLQEGGRGCVWRNGLPCQNASPRQSREVLGRPESDSPSNFVSRTGSEGLGGSLEAIGGGRGELR